MSDTLSAKGSCLCGNVKISAKTIKKTLGACHCTMCRKWGSGPYLSLDCGHEIEIQGQDSIKYFDSSEWAQRAFCKECGTSLFYHFKGANQYFLSAGLFDLDKEVEFHHEIYIEDQPSYYNFDADVIRMTGQEVIEKYTSDS